MAATAISATTAQELLNKLQPEGLEVTMFKAFPLFALMTKKLGFLSGEGREVAWKHAPGAGGSHTFSDAQGNASAGKYKRPFVKPIRNYGVGRIDGMMWQQTSGDKGKVAKALDEARADATYNLRRSMAIEFHGNGGGSRARIATYTGGASTFTVETKTQARAFEEGMLIQLSTADGTSGALRDSGNTATVSKVDVNSKTITVSAALDTSISGAAANDYVFRKGDFGAAYLGLDAWNPQTAPSPGESFTSAGIDRSVNPTRLAGHRISPSSGTISELLIELLYEMYGIGDSEAATVLMNPFDRANWEKEVEARKMVLEPRTSNGRKVSVGVNALQIDGPQGPVNVVSDPNLPKGIVRACMMESLQFWTAGKDTIPHVLSQDGLAVRAVSDADEYELRMGVYGEVCVTDPSDFGVLKLP